MSKRTVLYLLFVSILLVSTSVMIYLHTLQDIREGLMETLKTLDVYSVNTRLNDNLVTLNVSIKLENKAKYTVTVDSIQMKVYVDNIQVGSANPYNQPISFDVAPGEKCIIFFTCSSINRNIMKIMNKGSYVFCGNGTVKGHVSYYFITVSHVQLFNVMKTISGVKP